MRQAGEDVDGTRQPLHLRLIGIASDLHAAVHAASRIGVVRVRDVDVVGALALEQVRVESEPEEAVLAECLMHLVDRDRHRSRPIGRIDAGDSLANAFSDPQESIGSPRDLPRPGEVARDHSGNERLRSLGRHDTRVVDLRRPLRGRHEACGAHKGGDEEPYAGRVSMSH